MGIEKTATLFSHIKAITTEQDSKYWDTLSDASKKTWSNYMVHRFLSMNPDWVDLIAQLQPFTQTLPPEVLYKLYIGIIPKGKYWLKYVKGKKEGNYPKWLVDLICKDYMCSTRQSEDYLEILYATKVGRANIKYICKKYGTDPKDIKKLKL